MSIEQKIEEVISKISPTSKKFIGEYGDIMGRLTTPKGKLNLKNAMKAVENKRKVD